MSVASHPDVLGFGFIPRENAHHFVVTLSSRKNDSVHITEHFSYDDAEARVELSYALGREDNRMRVVLPTSKWDGIANAAKAEFNQRLRKQELPAGQWKKDRVPLSRLFGKELVLLCWAIEDADPALIPTAIRNWLGLTPEERWWLFTMTNAATGHALAGRDRGWRKAVRFALTDNPLESDAERFRGEDSYFHLVNEDGDRRGDAGAL
jgi:hypothetical protein